MAREIIRPSGVMQRLPQKGAWRMTREEQIWFSKLLFVMLCFITGYLLGLSDDLDPIGIFKDYRVMGDKFFERIEQQ